MKDDRYNKGKDFYKDRLSILGLYDPLPDVREYVGFTDAAIAGYMDAIAEDIRTLKERMTTDHLAPGDIGKLYKKGQDAYKNGEGAGDVIDHTSSLLGWLNRLAEDVRRLASWQSELERGCAAIAMPEDRRAELSNTLEHRQMGTGELLNMVPAYGPGSITDASRYKEFENPEFYRGWDAAIDMVLALAEKQWMYHTGREEPPYHLPRLGPKEVQQLKEMKKDVQQR